MQQKARQSTDYRVLVLAPIGNDAVLAQKILSKANIICEICKDAEFLYREARKGAGAILVAQEGLSNRKHLDKLLSLLKGQEFWSALPLVILTDTKYPLDANISVLRMLEHIPKVTFIERPVRIATLVSFMRTVLDARGRQYEVRDLFTKLQAGVRKRDEFLAMLGHELRNPLAAIEMSSNQLNRMDVADENLKNIGNIIGRQTQHLTRMVDDLLDVARVMRGKIQLRKEEVELLKILNDAITTKHTYAKEKNHQIEISLPKQYIWLNGDPTRLEQIFANLLDNAMKYTEPGGVISVFVETANGEVVIHVCDNGIGIAPEIITDIFELFTQDDKSLAHSDGGLGIGLTLVKNLVELHEGSIEAKSEGAGKGSEFIVRLPTILIQEVKEVDGEATQVKHDKMRVLIIDDNKDFAKALGFFVEDIGHDVKVITKSQEAIKVAIAFKPAAILLDLGMPGMDGYQAAQKLRELPELQDTLLVAVTGYGDQDYRRRSKEAGFDAHLVKPVDPDELEKVLRNKMGA